MRNLQTSRRQVIAALAVLPAVATTTFAVASDNPDAALLEQWNIRQNALAQIETRGSFYHCEMHSPAEAEAHSLAEDAIAKAHAQTLQGVLAQMWVAMAHCGGMIRTGRERFEQDIVRRADIDDVDAIGRHLDFEQYTLLAAIKSLTAIAKREA